MTTEQDNKTTNTDETQIAENGSTTSSPAETRQAKKAQKQQARQLAASQAAAARAKRTADREAKIPEEVKLAQKLAAIANLQRDNKKWYKLDNAALMYPLVARGESISIFRVSALLRDPVDPVELQYAVNDIAARFPTICGSVKNGFFWPFIDRPTIPITVKPQTKVPGRPMKVDSRRSQIRVNYIGNQISVEFFHSATDGTGGIIFLNSLLRRYFQRLGYKIDCTNVTVRGVMSASQLKSVAKQHNATVTEYLGAVQLMALNRLAAVTNSPENPPIRVLIPVNLRRIYDMETIRNFSSYIFYQYNGQNDIDEVIDDIRKQTEEQMTDDYFRGMVSFNYNNGNSPLLKIVPLAVKRFVLGCIVSGRGDGVVNCSTLSNLGVVKAPEQFDDLVLRYDFMLGKPAKKTNNFAVATYNDTCVISMTSPFVERDCEMYFFRKLAEAGINIAVESDIWEDKE